MGIEALDENDETEKKDERPLTAADLAPFTQGLEELRGAVQELREARTPEERREAREDAEDAEESLEKTARRLGVSRAKLEESIKAARAAERKEELRPIMVELLEELKGDAEPEPKPKPKPKPKAGANGRRETGEPPGDTAPVKEHWAEKSIGNLVR